MGKAEPHLNGTESGIRPLTSAEMPLYLQHLVRLDKSGRRLRFGCAMDNAALQAHCLALTATRATVICAFINGTMRGAAELAPARAPFDGFETAFSVESEFQRCGLCSALLNAAARLVSPRLLTLFCDADNRPMLDCAGKAGATITFCDDTAICTLRGPGVPAAPPAHDFAPLEQNTLLRGYV